MAGDDSNAMVRMAEQFGGVKETKEDKEHVDWHEYTRKDGVRMRMNLKTKERERVPDDGEQLAEGARLKGEGNDCFRAKDYENAILKYSQAIRCLPQGDDDAAWELKTPCILNRAQCHLNSSNWVLAIDDCETVLKRDPHNHKAIFRRAKAYFSQKKFKVAQDEFSRLAELDPTNKAAQQMVAKCAQMEKQIKRKQKEGFKKFFAGDSNTKGGSSSSSSSTSSSSSPPPASSSELETKTVLEPVAPAS